MLLLKADKCRLQDGCPREAGNVNDGNKTGRRAGALCCAAALTAFALLGVMSALTLWSADDMLYATFLDDGWRTYAGLLRWHYQEFNGRVLVHMAAQVILHFHIWFFVLVSLAAALAVPLSAGAAAGLERRQLPMAAAVFLCCLPAVPARILCQGWFWISAFCNYVLPTVMLCVLILLARGLERGGWGRKTAFVLLAAACGASTEQSGAAAVVLTVYFLIRALVKRRGAVTAGAACAVSVAGLASIFCSPATRKRMMTEVKINSLRELVEKLLKELGPAAGEFGESLLVPALFAALFILTGVIAGRRLKKRWPVLAGLALALAPAVSLFTAGMARALLYAALCVAAAVCAVCLIALGRETPGLLTLTGLATLGVILLTDSAGERTLLPLCLYFLAAVAVLAAPELARLGKGGLAAVMAGLTVFAVAASVPLLTGIVDNYKIELENRENIKTARGSGELLYNIDYDMTYTWTKCDVTFKEEFLRENGLPEDTPVYFYTRLRPNVIAGGVPHFPVLQTEEGEDYITIRVVEFLDGTVEPLNSSYTELRVVTPRRECTVTAVTPNWAVFTWTEDGKAYRLETPRIAKEGRTYFPIEAYTRALGLQVTFDGTDYYVSVPET